MAEAIDDLYIECIHREIGAFHQGFVYKDIEIKCSI